MTSHPIAASAAQGERHRSAGETRRPPADRRAELSLRPRVARRVRQEAEIRADQRAGAQQALACLPLATRGRQARAMLAQRA